MKGRHFTGLLWSSLRSVICDKDVIFSYKETREKKEMKIYTKTELLYSFLLICNVVYGYIIEAYF